MEDAEFDVIIIGGGVMGSSTAYDAAKRGLKTLLLEQFDFLHHRGSSHGESRTIRLTYPQHYYYPLVMDSYALWQQAQAQVGYQVYFQAHHLDMGPAHHPEMLAVLDYCRTHNIPFQLLNPDQVAHKFSGPIHIPHDWLALYNPYGGVIKPTKAVAMFQTLALRNGAVLRDNAEVVSIDKNKEAASGMVVGTAAGERFRGKKCVVTAGAWAGKLVKAVSGVEVPIQPLETHACYWRVKEGQEGKLAMGSGFPTFSSFGDVYVYGTPTLEFPGLIKVAVHGGKPCDPDKRPWGPGFMMDALKTWVEERFPGMVDSSEPVIKQCCMYSMTPDEDFLIDFLGGHFGNDVVVGAGFSGHGFKMAPAIARILVDLALHGETKWAHIKHFSIARFKITSRF
ncbi:hypothetical protein Fmac_000849 [Flemingia macrophylla]|uniref:FAD dependent oxidoreductase domain-containing protein n=1 Tax=Flemingia macrophylla TaxID=520843 RepID=A0ABD1NFE8_9FABA